MSEAGNWPFNPADDPGDLGDQPEPDDEPTDTVAPSNVAIIPPEAAPIPAPPAPKPAKGPDPQHLGKPGPPPPIEDSQDHTTPPPTGTPVEGDMLAVPGPQAPPGDG